MKKKGIFIVKQESGKWVFKIKRADGRFLDLNMDKVDSPESYLDYNEKECDYFKKKSQFIVWLDDKEIYNVEKKLPPPQRKKEQLSLSALQDKHRDDTTETEPIFEVEVKPMEHRLEGKNLFAFNSRFTKLPKETRKEIKLDKVENFSLKLNKAVHFFDISSGKIKFDSDKVKPILFQNKAQDSKDKKKKFHFHIKEHYGLEKAQFEKIAQNQKEAAESICQIETQTFQPDWRLVVGLGGASVYETSMTLHHIYGFPYIPASSVKGVVRSWIITELFLPQIPENVEKRGEKAEKKALQEKVFCDIFGCPAESHYNEARQGKAIFFDAFPTEPPTIEVDIMNPHYQPYYSDSSNSTPPADYHPTNPIPFLTVANTPFQFLVGSRELDLSKDENKINGKTLDLWLKDALENHGIGAKTAVGYGYMTKQ